MRLIFGIRTTGTVSLSITAQGPLPKQPPSLMIKTNTQVTAVCCSNNTWCATVGAGDQIVYLPAAGDSWFDAPLTLTLSAPATIVSLDSNTAPQAWVATEGTVGVLDVKNPWPPPNLSKLDAPLLDAAWLTTTLVQMSPPSDVRWTPEEPAARPGMAR
jgi:hypothetical protein